MAYGLHTEGIENDVKLQDDKRKSETQRLRLWISDTVGLPQYYPVFLQNGYETLDIVKEITDKQELIDIGINHLQHQYRILAEVCKLNLQQTNTPCDENLKNYGKQRLGYDTNAVLNIVEESVTHL